MRHVWCWGVLSTTPLKIQFLRIIDHANYVFKMYLKMKRIFVLECPLYESTRNRLLSLLQNVVLNNLKSVLKSCCQLDHEVDINFFLKETIAFCYF